jgi:hypothetical protein
MWLPRSNRSADATVPRARAIFPIHGFPPIARWYQRALVSPVQHADPAHQLEPLDGSDTFVQCRRAFGHVTLMIADRAVACSARGAERDRGATFVGQSLETGT